MNQIKEINQPEKKFRAGGISATVWKNTGISQRTGQPTEYRTISLQRAYTDKDGKWQHTASFRINDLPKASVVLNQAYEFLVTMERNNNNQITEEPVM